MKRIKIIVMDIDGVLTDGKLEINSEGKESKQISFRDIDAIFEMKRRYKIGMITGEKTPIVDYFEKRFSPDYFYSGCKEKEKALVEIKDKAGVDSSEICYIGDGKHDVDAVVYAGIGVCPSDAIQEVRSAADIILKSPGGQNCIHELLGIVDGINHHGESPTDALYDEHIRLFSAMRSDLDLNRKLMATVDCVTQSLANGGQLFLCGNGGSAADSQHIAAEFIGRFFKERKAYRAEALTVNTSILTALANDYSYEMIFARQLEGRAKAGDVLIGLSTSGKSPNVIAAFRYARSIGVKTIALVGKDTAADVAACADIVINVPSVCTPRIQEAHIFIGHLISQYVEENLTDQEAR